MICSTYPLRKAFPFIIFGVFFALNWPVVSEAKSTVQFSRSCLVFSKPDSDSKRVCKKKAGDIISRVSVEDEDFLKITSEGCTGYVPTSCLDLESRRKKRGSIGVTTAASPTHRFRVGLFTELDALWARVSTTVSPGSSGFGVGGGLVLAFPLGKRFQITLKPAFQLLSLSRAIDGTGEILTDANPAEFTHSVLHVGGGVMASFLIKSSLFYEMMSRDPDWWIDGGAEYLHPISAKQTDSTGGETSFTTNDRPVFVFLGTSGDFALSRKVAVIGYFQALFNVAAKNGHILGVRLTVALSYSL